jgi:hypothetical protein
MTFRLIQLSALTAFVAGSGVAVYLWPFPGAINERQADQEHALDQNRPVAQAAVEGYAGAVPRLVSD